VPTLTLYGKPDCHLCDDALDVVKRVSAGRDVALEHVDISRDPALHARFGERIPVLELDGEQLFELFVDEGALQQRLDRVAS
jgi:hypothetical protein